MRSQIASADEWRGEAVRRYGLGEDGQDLARQYGVSWHTIRRWASEAGIRRGSLAEGDGGAEHETGISTGPLPSLAAPPTTRRCRYKLCISRFVPVNQDHWWHSAECRAQDPKLQWSVEEILSEEAAVSASTHPLEMARVAFGQKNKILRENSRLRGLRQYLSYEVRSVLSEKPELVIPEVPLIEHDKPTARTPREVLLVCSDWQIGKMENGIGVAEMSRRWLRIVDAFIKIVQHFRDSGHPVERAHVLFAGDMLEGCYIYGGQNVSGLDRTGNTHRITRQIRTVAELEANLAVEASRFVREIVVHSVPGNHGKPNGKNDFADPEDNFDTMCAWWARDIVGENPRITWDIEEDWFCRFNVFNHNVVAIHGDQWRGPFSKIEQLLPSWVLADTFGCRPDLFITAHRHDFVTQRVNGVNVLQNGTIDGGSLWYQKAYGKASPPAQALVVMSPERAVEAIYPIDFPRKADPLNA